MIHLLRPDNISQGSTVGSIHCFSLLKISLTVGIRDVLISLLISISGVICLVIKSWKHNNKYGFEIRPRKNTIDVFFLSSFLWCLIFLILWSILSGLFPLSVPKLRGIIRFRYQTEKKYYPYPVNHLSRKTTKPRVPTIAVSRVPFIWRTIIKACFAHLAF